MYDYIPLVCMKTNLRKPESSCFAKSNRKLSSCVADNECYYTVLLLQKSKEHLASNRLK